MLLSILQALSTRQTLAAQSKTQPTPLHSALLMSACFGMLSLSACQTAPTSATSAASTTAPSAQTLPSTHVQKTTPLQQSTSVTQTPRTDPSDHNDYESVQSTEADKGDDNYPIEPYRPPVSAESPTEPPIASVTEKSSVIAQPIESISQNPIVTQPDTVILTPAREDDVIYTPSIPSHNELLERARQNSQRSQKTTSNNNNLPAFRNLMQVGTDQLKAGNINGAESSFTRAQRLAPKSSAVYFYLAQVALKKNQPRKAEAMARRGLSVSQDSSRRRALWQIILQSGQAQGNARVVKEAKQALR
ncbi:tetratricopeptide repeat protein [Psychrobacter sp.]|uniref:tetratricopeptide repeat protein n=1 Tax=Psychrobacter sp. TaxID=56811 RepID=UPI003567A3E1